MECRHADELHDCLLFDRQLTWRYCYEVQEIREDNMDMELFPEIFDLKKANAVCEKCRWYVVAEWGNE